MWLNPNEDLRAAREPAEEKDMDLLQPALCLPLPLSWCVWRRNQRERAAARSMEQKAAMIHLIRQSIGELRDTATTSGSNSPLPLPSPLHNPSPLAHPHNLHLSSYSPSLRHPLLPPSHSSPRHTRPRSNSQPHLQNLTPSPHPSPLAHSHHLPSLTDLSKH
ncbi:hypothetical protein GBAR_LOCUS27245 [Geodia barretti]|uniref:Uncharacterized protein n=1 Tax=Geodia barretti TaxID=519541 RepID=A0AA35TJX2_GEOBA|nr:hypothetical protein GBAR_LOCUS27245 [Geodia barretti]